MNIIQKLTLRHMYLNKRRTLVTALGIVISVAMITAVSTFAGSFLDLMRRDTLARTGDWQVEYQDISPEQAALLAADSDAAKAGMNRFEGYLQLPDPGRANRPYLFRRDFDQQGFEILPMELKEGRMPEQPGEIIVLENFLKDNDQYKIGDTMTLPLGARVLYEGQEDQMEISRNNRLNLEETFVPSGQTEQCVIVGTFAQKGLYAGGAGYEAYGLLQQDGRPVTMQVKAKRPERQMFQRYTDLAESAGLTERQLEFNSTLLRSMGLVNNAAAMGTLYMMELLVIAIIIVGSVSLIYNAFAISLSERSRYLGMLSSVGATRAQKRSSVFFEGAVLGAMAIPLGLISGVVGIGITFRCISPLLTRFFSVEAALRVKVSWGSMAMAVAFSALTIFISAYVPARRASRISAIDAIRQTGDIKLRQRTVKTWPITRKIFGFPAELGLKNLKRNRGRYRATVFSLIISIVLFLSASTLSAYMRRGLDMTAQGLDFDVLVYASGDHAQELDNAWQLFEQVKAEGLAETAIWSNMQYNADLLLPRELLSQKTLEQLPPELRQEAEFKAELQLISLDEDSYQAYLKEAGVQPAELEEGQYGAVLVNDIQLYKGNYQFERYEATNLTPGDRLTLRAEGEKGTAEIPLQVTACSGLMPAGMSEYVQDPLTIVLIMEQGQMEQLAQRLMEQTGRDGLCLQTQMYFTSQDPEALCESLEELSAGFAGGMFYVENMEEQRQAAESLTIIIQVFTYGFVILLALISVANIFNTLSTSIALRKREFAMLKSVGMTPQGFNQMMDYESLFYGLKALLYGLPISFGVMVLMYQIMARNLEFGFFVPWGSVAIAVAAVYLVVGVTMLYGGKKIKKQNIIEGLRQENI